MFLNQYFNTLIVCEHEHLTTKMTHPMVLPSILINCNYTRKVMQISQKIPMLEMFHYNTYLDIVHQ